MTMASKMVGHEDIRSTQAHYYALSADRRRIIGESETLSDVEGNEELEQPIDDYVFNPCPNSGQMASRNCWVVITVPRRGKIFSVSTLCTSGSSSEQASERTMNL